VYRYANCQFAVIPRLASGRRKLTVCVTWLRLYAALLRACQNPERLRRDQTRTWFLIRSLPLPVLTQRQKRRQAAALQISLRQNNSLYHVSKARVVAVGASLSNATNGVPSTRQNFSASPAQRDYIGGSVSFFRVLRISAVDRISLTVP